MKKYFKFIALVLLVVPVPSFASLADTVRLYNETKSLEVSAGDLIASNQSLRQALDYLYEVILKSLKEELRNLLPQTTSVSFNMVPSQLTVGALQAISFNRIPENTSSPINFTIEFSGGALVGSLANDVTTNSIGWQVANNFTTGRTYVITVRNAKGDLLGRSNSFTVIAPVVVSETSKPVTVVTESVTLTPILTPISEDVGSSDINFGSLGFWSFDRSSNLCSTKGGATVNADGKIGVALGLNGTDAYCMVPNNRSYYPKNFTLSLWAKSASTENGGWNDSGWFVSLRDRSGYNIGPVKGLKDVQFTILDDTNLNQVPYIVGTVTPDDITKWHHYAMTYNGNTANVYLDGVLVNSTTTIINRNYAGDKDLYFGLDNISGQPKGAGTLDEIRIYNRAMTACEIRFLAGGNCAGITSLPFGVNVAALLLGI